MGLNWDPASDLGPYIDTHLAYELKYLLVAATTWSALHAEADHWRDPNQLVTMAMESAFLHTRNLCEFLALDGRWKNRPSPHQPPPLPLWDAYTDAMHMKVLHPDPRRPYEPGQQGGDDLMERVVDLAVEVLDGWLAVLRQQEMAQFRSVMDRAGREALREAQEAADRLGVLSPFSGR